MPAFKYQAIDAKGSSQTGIIDADSSKQARYKLREKNLFPVDVKAITAHPARRFKWGKGIKSRELALLTRQLATLVAAGIPLEQALQGASEQAEKSNIKEILRSVRSRVLEGYSLADALKQEPSVFSSLYCETVHAGEQTGKLDLVLERLADYTEEQSEMQAKIQQALIYPIIMILVSLAIIAFLLTHVIPKIIGVFHSTGQSLPPLTIALIQFSHFIKQDGWILLIIIVGSFFVFRYLNKLQRYRELFHYTWLRLPLIGYLIRLINTARYAHTLSILVNAGVPLLQAMTTSAKLMTNDVLKERVIEAAQKVKEGGKISQALKATKVFTPMMVYLIMSGENSGTLENMLSRAAETQDKEITRIINTGLTLFEPLIILIMGAVVLFIVLATLLPIFSMNQLVN